MDVSENSDSIIRVPNFEPADRGKNEMVISVEVKGLVMWKVLVDLNKW